MILFLCIVYKYIESGHNRQLLKRTFVASVQVAESHRQSKIYYQDTPEQSTGTTGNI